jgi:hypothetical protein
MISGTALTECPFLRPAGDSTGGAAMAGRVETLDERRSLSIAKI